MVAEQTGYPAEMLAMDLDLEADLGIDTVKQAELFATIREEYGIEREDKLQLRDYPTLTHVVGFVTDRTPQAPAAVIAPPAPVAAAAATATASDSAFADVDGFARRVPVAVLRPALELCIPTGVALGAA